MAEYIVVDEHITELWCQVYEAIRQAWIHHGMAPSQHEIAKVCRCSIHSVQNALKALRKHGHITQQKFETRSAKPVDLDRKLYRYEPDPWANLEETKVWQN